MKTPVTQHIHCDVIIAWAEGYQIQFYSNSTWTDIINPVWHEDSKYRVKPEVTYPKTTIDPAILFTVFNQNDDGILNDLERVANAALEHFVTSSDLEAYLKTRNSNI